MLYCQSFGKTHFVAGQSEAARGKLKLGRGGSSEACMLRERCLSEKRQDGGFLVDDGNKRRRSVAPTAQLDSYQRLGSQ